MKIKKLTLSVILWCFYLFIMPCIAFAEEEDDMYRVVEETYQKAKEAAGLTSFHGLCTKATSRQMEQVGIVTNCLTECPTGHGYTWFNEYKKKDGQITSKGYTIICQEGGDALNQLLETYGQPLYDIVVSYGTGGVSGSNHVMFIHGIIDDIVYFTDSYRYARLDVEEGQAWPSVTVSQYNQYFRKMYGYSLGAVYFQGHNEEWVWDEENNFWKYRIRNGNFAKGWKKIDNHQYYFKEDTSLTHSGFYMIDGNWYLFSSEGFMLTGWQYYNDEWYFMGEEGRMQTNRFANRDGQTYYLGPDGNVLKGICITIDGVEYEIDCLGNVHIM